MVYGGYFLVLGIVFMIMNICTVVHYLKNEKPLKIWVKDSESVFESRDGMNELD